MIERGHKLRHRLIELRQAWRNHRSQRHGGPWSAPERLPRFIRAKGSGWADGHRRGPGIWFRYRIRQVVRRLADEKPQHAAEGVPSHLLPIPVASWLLVLLLAERFLPEGFLPHQDGDAAAKQADAVEQRVPELAGAEARYHRKVETDFNKSSAERAAAHLRLELLQSRHEEFGIVPAGWARRWCLVRGWHFGRLLCCRHLGRLFRRLSGWRIAWRGRGRGRALARCDEVDIATLGGALEQYALQCGGAQQAALQMREDRAHPPGAEAGRDGVEVGTGGAMLRGCGEMAAEAEHDADGVQQGGDARGHGADGPIPLGIVGGGRAGCGNRGVLHGSINNGRYQVCQAYSGLGRFGVGLTSVSLHTARDCGRRQLGSGIWCMGFIPV